MAARKASFGAALGLTSMLAATPALAAGVVELPADCGTSSEFAREVDARLPPNVPRPAPDVSISPAGTHYLLKLRFAQESREFSHADCRELFRVAVVVTVAMSLSHVEPLEQKQPTAKPRPEGETKAAQPPPERVEPRSSTTTTGPSWGFGGSVASGASFGMAPRPVLQLELEGRVMRGELGVALNFRYRTPRGEQDANDRGVRVSSIGGELAFVARPHRLLEGWVGASVYRVFGTGLGATVSQREDAAWSAGPALGLTLIPLQRSGTWVGVGGELYLDLIQPEFKILNYDTVFDAPLFSGSAFLRVGHIFN